VVKRGEIWLVGVDPALGSELKKSRLCVVLSPAETLDYLPTAIVAPMTTTGRPAPFRVPIGFRGKRGLILLDQIRAVDQTRMVRRLGVAGKKPVVDALAILQAMFAL